MILHDFLLFDDIAENNLNMIKLVKEDFLSETIFSKKRIFLFFPFFLFILSYMFHFSYI